MTVPIEIFMSFFLFAGVLNMYGILCTVTKKEDPYYLDLLSLLFSGILWVSLAFNVFGGVRIPTGAGDYVWQAASHGLILGTWGVLMIILSVVKIFGLLVDRMSSRKEEMPWQEWNNKGGY